MSSPRLPSELLDHAVDFLHDSRRTLKSCSLVSKAWIPRARKHLFAAIWLSAAKEVELWKVAFPDPSASPAWYTTALFINSPDVIAAAVDDDDCWVSAFSRVVHLKMDVVAAGFKQISISLVPFHRFSPVLRSLRVVSTVLTPSQIFDLLRSFPLLEDLSVTVHNHSLIKDYRFENQPTIIKSSNSPALNGSLQLFSKVGMDPFISPLLSLPNGLHFRNVDLAWYHVTDVSSTTELVEGCYSTLESLSIDGSLPYFSQPTQVNLGKAKKLKDLSFACWMLPGWILATLRTIARDHRELERITLTILSSQGLNEPEDVKRATGGAYPEWLEVDRLLAQLSESHSIRVNVVYDIRRDAEGERERGRMEILLPEVVTRGIVDLVGRGKCF